MQIATIIFIAIGLAMDAFAVSITSGAAYKELHVKHTLRIALFFGGFQAIMPILGYFAGQQIIKYVAAYDHWIAFGLLTAIGLKMIWESRQLEKSSKDPSQIIVLLALAIATSIDALAVGFTLSLLTVPILLNAIIIGVITFILSLAGVYIGKKIGHLFENKIEIIGGIVLIIIGLKILITG